jgi:hypothetical protein
MIIYNGFQIKPVTETPTLSLIVTDGKGGKIPNILSGYYTTKQYAKEAIDLYVNQKAKKGE